MSPTPKTKWLSTGFENIYAEFSADTKFDVVIVGSGYGGAIAAAHYAAIDKKVLVLERGEEYLANSFPTRLAELPGHVRLNTKNSKGRFQNKHGLFDVVAGTGASALVANGLGGGSLINAGVMEIPRRAVFDESWPEPIRTDFAQPGQSLFDDAKNLVGAEMHQNPEKFAKFIALKDLHGEPSQTRTAAVSISLNGGINQSGVELQPCVECGDCFSGCNHNAKNSLDLNLLVEARRKGARLYTGATVLRLNREDFGWTLVCRFTSDKLYRQHKDAVELKAKKVILAAGTFGSTGILKRSETNELVFSKHLGKRFSGNGDMIAARYNGPKDTNSAPISDTPPGEREVGSTISGVIDRTDSAGPFVIEDLAIPSSLRPMLEEVLTLKASLDSLGTFNKSKHDSAQPRNDPFSVDHSAVRNSLVVACMGNDNADGEIVSDDLTRESHHTDATVRAHWPDAADKPVFKEFEKNLHSLVRNADANRKPGEASSVYFNPTWKPLPGALAKYLELGDISSVFTVHPLGGCVMGTNRTDGVVNHLGQVFRQDVKDQESVYDDLLVLDGSIIPRALCTNPALTIAAVALRSCRQLKQGSHAGAAPRNDNESQTGDYSKRPTLPVGAPDDGHSVRTQINIKEKMVGRIELDRPIEGTRIFDAYAELHFDPTPLESLTANVTPSDPNVPCRIMQTANQGTTVKNQTSRIRLCPADSEHSRLVPESTWIIELEIKGTLEIFKRRSSSHLFRTLVSALSWLFSRGIRELIRTKLLNPLYDLLSAKKDHLSSQQYDRRSNRNNKEGRFAVFKAILESAGERRTFDYQMRIKRINTRNSSGREIEEFAAHCLEKPVVAQKTIGYTRYGNPWEQLTESAILEFPWLARGSRYNRLRLDPSFLAKLSHPLMAMTRYRNLPDALVDSVQTALYFVRMLVSMHLLSFRLPEEPRNPQTCFKRLPREDAIPGVKGKYIPLTVDNVEIRHSEKYRLANNKPLPKGYRSDLKINLTRYRNFGPPVMLIHGYSVSGNSFAHDALKPGFAAFLHQHPLNFDIWIVDLRTSPGVVVDGLFHNRPGPDQPVYSSELPSTFEDVALADIPIAVDAILKARPDCSKVKVVAHCMGAAMFSMSALSALRSINEIIHDPVQRAIAEERERKFGLCELREKLPGKIESLVISQVPPTVVFKPDNIFKSFLTRQVIQSTENLSYNFQKDWSKKGIGDLFDRLLYTLPYSKDERRRETPINPLVNRDYVATRHRVDALYSQNFILENAPRSFLKKIDDFFGNLNLATVRQAAGFGQYNMITNGEGHNVYIKPGLQKVWNFRTMVFHGAENSLFDPSSVERFESVWKSHGISIDKAEIFEGYGHLDWLIAKTAEKDIYDGIADFLKETTDDQEGAKERSNEPDPNFPQLELPAFGPVFHDFAIEQKGQNSLPLIVGTHPVSTYGESVWLVAVPVYTAPRPGNGYSYLPLPENVTSSDFSREDAKTYLSHSCWLQPLGRPDTLVHRVKLPVEVFEQKKPIDGNHSSVWKETQSTDNVLLLHVNDIPFYRDDKDVVLQRIVAKIFRLFYIEQGGEGASAFGSPRLGVEPNSIRLGIVHRPVTYDRNERSAVFRLAVASCLYPGGLGDQNKPVAAFRQMSNRSNEERPDKLILLGDQIYADATAGLFDPSSRNDRYFHRYIRFLEQPEVKHIFRKIPTYMMLDDHEIVNDWEPDQANSGPPPTDATEAYKTYQRPDAPLSDDRLFMQIDDPGFRAFVINSRTERAARNVHNIANVSMISDHQMDEIRKWLGTPTFGKPIFLCSPSRLLPRNHQSDWSEGFGGSLHSDGWDGFPKSLFELLHAIHSTRPEKLVVVCGDIHAFGIHRVSISREGSDAAFSFNVIHSSGLNAPMPFAAHQLGKLKGNDEFSFRIPTDNGEELRYHIAIETVFFREDVNGFAEFIGSGVSDALQIECVFQLTKDGHQFESHRFSLVS
ncbi:MAG: alkaline phosphatase D family protein [Pseudomonadota bacterium]